MNKYYSNYILILKNIKFNGKITLMVTKIKKEGKNNKNNKFLTLKNT